MIPLFLKQLPLARILPTPAFLWKKSDPLFWVTFKTGMHSVSEGKKCSFFGKFHVLCFLETPVLRFALLPYYRRFIRGVFRTQSNIMVRFFCKNTERLSAIIYFHKKVPWYIFDSVLNTSLLFISQGLNRAPTPTLLYALINYLQLSFCLGLI